MLRCHSLCANSFPVLSACAPESTALATVGRGQSCDCLPIDSDTTAGNSVKSMHGIMLRVAAWACVKTVYIECGGMTSPAGAHEAQRYLM